MGEIRVVVCERCWMAQYRTTRPTCFYCGAKLPDRDHCVLHTAEGTPK